MSVTALKERVLPAAFNKDGSKFKECELDLDSAGEDQFQSTVVFVTAVVQRNYNNIVKIPLVIKFEPANEELKQFMNTSVQFYNEVLMYGEVLPFLDKNNYVEDTFAQYYYGVGSVEEPEDNVVVIQDLRPLGYRLTEDKGFIDYNHFVLAMAKLGRFHALSYVAKKDAPKKFYNLAHRLKEVSWQKEGSFNKIVIACIHRAVDPLLNEGKHVQVLQRFLDRVEHSVGKFMTDLMVAEEPLAVICHGDFCRNNVLFKYDDGKPTDVKFFDIATSRYSSPAIDISFFFFLNSSRDLRRAHWDDLLSVYHQALSSAIPGTEVPSLDEIKKEVIQKAVYGFVHCSFFLPMMIYENPHKDLENITKISDEELVQMHVDVGGQEGTKLLSEMVEELVERGCLNLENKFLQY